MADKHDLTTAQKVADTAVEEKLGQSALSDAKQATDDEHAQTFFQALNENRKAAFWSIAISMAIIMEGYDTILIGNFMAYPEFQQKFGQYYPEKDRWEVSASWQSGLNMGSTVGAIFGGLINGYLISRFGYRWVLIGSMGLLNAFIFVVFFAKDNAMLLGGQILCGLSWGVFATLCPSYASEVCPTNLRGYLTTYVNLCWAIGQLLATGVLRGCLGIPGEMGYKVPFAIQWLWPVPLMVVAYLAPESPWYLVRVDRIEEARHSIQRLSGNKTQEQMNNQLAMIMHTVKVESQTTKGGSYLDCFKGVNLRRTEIVCLTFMGQILSGSSFAYTPTYFFTSAGMPTVRAFDLSLGAKAMGFIGTCLSWFLITYFGRRTIYVSGMGVLSVLLFLVGVLNVSAGQNALWPSGGLCVAWLFVYSLTIGPLAYSITSETSSVRLRPLSVVLARVSYQLINIVSQVLSPYMVNPTAWDWSGKTGFFWSGTAALMFVWAYFRLPEIKGRTYEELDILFEARVPTRKFASTHVDAYTSSAALTSGVDEDNAQGTTHKQ